MRNWLYIKSRFVFEFQRIKRQGLLHIVKKLFSHFSSYVLCILLFPITLSLHLCGFRRVTVFTDRIGHLALEPDCLLKEVLLGRVPQRRWIMLAPAARVSNRHLLHYWKAHFHIIENPTLCFVIEAMTRLGLMRKNVSRYILAPLNCGQLAYSVQTQWGSRAPLLELSDDDRTWGKHALAQLGLPQDTWFVCLHVRESGFSPIDESIQSHRNGSIAAALAAIESITAQGGWVIRIGDSSMTPLPRLPGVIDYAHHPLKSERLDIVLCARARFILGNTSGIALVGTIFGTPCAIANTIPISTLWFRSEDLSIPKLLWSNDQQRYLAFGEAMALPIANFNYAGLYDEFNIRVDENSAEDIRDLAVEMLARLNNEFSVSGADETDWARVKKYFLPHHFGYDSCARIAATFIRKHAALMPDKSIVDDGDNFNSVAISNSRDASTAPSAEQSPSRP